MSPPNAPRPHPSPSLSAHGHPPYHQPTHDPVGNPTIQMPEVQATPVPSYTSSAPLLMGETSGETMYMPDPLNNIQPAPVPYLSYPLQTPVVSHPPSQHGGPGGMLGNEHTSAHVQGYRACVPSTAKICVSLSTVGMICIENELNDGRYPSGQVPSSTPHTYMQSRSPPGCGAAGLRPEQRRDSGESLTLSKTQHTLTRIGLTQLTTHNQPRNPSPSAVGFVVGTNYFVMKIPGQTAVQR